MEAADSGLWRRLSPLLDHALELEPGDRAAYLDTVRERDPDLARELESLVASHDAAAAESFLEASPAHPTGSPLAPGHTLGAYTLLAEIGHGGMGNVWLAERTDGRFQRKVAIKFLSMALVGRGGEERFRREGRLLAQVTHPNIAQLLDAGVTPEGRPYLVLEHVDGEPIDRYCNARRLGVEARLELFFAVLAAVADAHARLIVHRDLKPSNVLVTADGQVKLLDFGIAKLADEHNSAAAETRLTRLGGWALTPEYAAPEQVTGAPISTATDVYALGVMLYELLSGRHPVGVPLNAPLDLVKAVVETVPRHMSEATADDGASDTIEIANARSTTPERLRARLKGELDTIVRKTLKKEPAERYSSVMALADDLRRYLRHEPITARPDSAAYRARKFARRNRVGVALSGLALVAVIAGITATSIQARTAREERDYALSQLKRAEALNDLDHFLLSEAAPLGRPLEVTELLERAEDIARRQTAGGPESRVNLLLSVGDQYRSMDEADRALDLLQLAYDEAHATADASMRARSACALAGALAKGDGLQRARELVAEGLATLPDGSRFTQDRIYCLRKASYVARENGEAATAIAEIEKARALLTQSPYRSEIQDLKILIDVAESYSRAGRFAEAVPAFERAAAIMASLGRDQTQNAGTLYNNWALSLDISGRPRDAEAIYRRAIEVSRADATNETVSPMLLINYGRSLRSLGRLDEAARYAEEGYSRAQESGLEVVVNQSLLLRSSIYRERGDVARAVAMLDEVEPRLRQALPPEHPAFGALLVERAMAAQAGGNSVAALDLIDRACVVVDAARRSGGTADYAPRVLIRRAEIRNSARLHAEAAADARLALSYLDDALPSDAFSTLRADAWLALGRALLPQGQRDEGQAALRQALANLDSALGAEHPRTVEVRMLVTQGA